MTDRITINDRAAFQATLTQIDELNKALGAEAGKAASVTAAVTTAAGKDVVTGETSGGGAKVAAAYAGTVTALEQVASSVTKKAESATAAVSAAVSDLTALLNGTTQIDTNAADAVNRAG